MGNAKTAKLKLIIAVELFGTIGIFVKFIPLPSSVIACARGFIGALLLVLIMRLTKQRPNYDAIRRKLPLLCISGVMIAANWILLFEAYRYTTVAVATLCYYMAPVIVILLSPLILHERLTPLKLVCSAVAVIGMVLVSGVFGGGSGSFTGILLGLGAAVIYAAVVIANKFLDGVSAYERTVVQLGAAAISVLPYVLLTEDIPSLTFTPVGCILLAVVGIVHTGLAYAAYFGSLSSLKAQTVALYSYIDPTVAIILSALILHERLTVYSVVGAVLILGATIISDLKE